MGSRTENFVRVEQWRALEVKNDPRAVYAVPADALRWLLRKRMPIVCGGGHCPRCSDYVYQAYAEGRPPMWAARLTHRRRFASDARTERQE